VVRGQALVAENEAKPQTGGSLVYRRMHLSLQREVDSCVWQMVLLDGFDDLRSEGTRVFPGTNARRIIGTNL